MGDNHFFQSRSSSFVDRNQPDYIAIIMDNFYYIIYGLVEIAMKLELVLKAGTYKQDNEENRWYLHK